MSSLRSARSQFFVALGVSSLVSVGLFCYGAIQNGSTTYDYLIWNLFLAWLPLLFAIKLVQVLKTKLWSSWEALFYSFLWILFLPNSFYMISDYIHLQEFQRDSILFDSLMFTSFIYTAIALGFSSLYLVHLQLLRRFSGRATASWIALTLFVCSASIYVGRDLRWNSWDVFTNTGGLLFDLSDRLVNPSSHPEMFVTIISFWVLLLSMYFVLWRATKLLQQMKTK